MKILIYTFDVWNNIAFKVLKDLDITSVPVVKKFIWGNRRGAEALTNFIVKNKFTHILGLGDYRKNAKRIRIEGRFINKYGRSKIDIKGKYSYKSTWDLPILENMYISDKPSNGPCNRSGYLLAQAIEMEDLDTKLGFVHIPRKFEKGYFNRIQKIISNWI